MIINARSAVYVVASAFILYGLTFKSPYPGTAEGAARAVSIPPKATPPAPAALPQAEEVVVTETGDPESPGETFAVDLLAVNDALSESHALAAFPSEQRRYKDARRVAEAMLGYALELAERQPPVTRQSNPRQIQKFVRLFNYQSERVPFCAMGVAFAAAKAYCDLMPERVPYNGANDTRTFKSVIPLVKKYYFTPSASCLFMMNEAKKRRSTQRGGWVAKGTRAPRRGWLVLFDWKNKGDGVPDHVGIVRASGGRHADRLYTVEFNTSVVNGNQRDGGAVAKKVRSMDDVLGYIRTY